jgi:hypothetical protein
MNSKKATKKLRQGKKVVNTKNLAVEIFLKNAGR